MTIPDPSEQLRRLCLALPQATEQAMKRGPTYRIADKIFAMDRSVDGGVTVWCKVPAGSQALMIEAAPQLFFVPPYVGPKGWIGMRLEPRSDWTEVTRLVRQSYRLIAPRKLAALLS